MARTIIIETALGSCGFSWEEQGVQRFSLPQESEKALLKRIGAELPSNPPDGVPGWVRDLASRVRKHLAGDLDDFKNVPLDFSGLSPFEAAVYRQLRMTRPGMTTTYGALAAAVGEPGGARAVGRAMATNPLPLLVPCHRVLAAGGELHGFSAYGGLDTKDRLLEIEGVRLAKQGELFP